MKVLWVHNFSKDIVGAGTFITASYGALLDSAADVSIEQYRLENLSSIRSAYRQYRALQKHVKSNQYDLVHAQFGSVCGLICSFLKCRKILTLRGSDWYPLPFRYRKTFTGYVHSLMQSACTRLRLKSYDAVVCVSKSLENEVKSFAPKIRTLVIPSPIDLKIFKRIDKKLARQKLGWPEDKKIVIFSSISRGNPIKRAELAIEAVSLLTENGYILKFGSGFAPRDMPFVYSAADVLLMTSIYEGWPNSIKEAVACGTPFVSTRVSDLTEYAARTRTGLVAASIPSDIAEKIVLVSNFHIDDAEDRVQEFSFSNFELKIRSLYFELEDSVKSSC